MTIWTQLTMAFRPAEIIEAENALALVESLDEILLQMSDTCQYVPRFAEAAQAMDLEGRCERLKDHLKYLAKSPTVDMYDDDLDKFYHLFASIKVFLKTLVEARMAPKSCWDRWLRPGGRYARRLARLNNQLNDKICDHILNINVHLPQTEVTKTFPPTVEMMRLSSPSTLEEEEPTVNLPTKRLSDLRTSLAHRSSLSIDTQSTYMSNGSMASSIRSTRTEDVGSSMRSTRSRDGMDSSISFSMRSDGDISMFSQISTEESGLPKIAWDVSPRTVKQDKWWNGSSQVARSRKDRNELYVKTQVLREMPQDSPVKELRIVLAQLEAGDTSPGIVAGRYAMMAVGAVGALMVSPLAVLGGVDAKDAVTQTPMEAAAVFSHYLIEFELENGTIGTLENCVEDIYLYAGKSQRQHQHTVCRIPMTPGAVGSPDSLTKPLLLQDLIQFRNTERLTPYRLWDNNCKHFCFLALTSGDLFPRATNYEEDSLDVFFALCQGCYVQKDTFDVFTKGGGNQSSGAELARQIMTLWEQDLLDCSSRSSSSGLPASEETSEEEESEEEVTSEVTQEEPSQEEQEQEEQEEDIPVEPLEEPHQVTVQAS